MTMTTKTISKSTQGLVQIYQQWHNSIQSKENIPCIHVDEVASRVASFYEKIKGVVDWQEEHLLRKRAIERTLKRRIIFKKENKEMAESLICELISGGHFPNDSIPESKIATIQRIIDKYFFILENFPKKEEEEKNIKLKDWLLDIASFELEKTLAPSIKEEGLIEYMTESIKNRIEIKKGIITTSPITEREKNIQIYIGIQRALFKLDESTIAYNLFEKQYPEWQKISSSSVSLPEICANIFSTKQKIEKALNHSLADKFYVICERLDTPYLILGDMIAENPIQIEKTFKDPEAIEALITKTYNIRLKKLKARLRRAAIYTTVSIFVTKVALALILEVPIDKYLTNDFSFQVLAINILFPVFLMFLLVISIKPPQKGNLERVMMEVMKIIFQQEKKEIYQIKIPRKKGKILNAIMFIFYSFACFTTFGVIIWILKQLNFGLLSMAIFLFFVSVISFFGIKIRQRSNELVMEARKETFLLSLFDFFFLPIIRIGKWFSEKWGGLNIALTISILIDAPFFTFVGFLEQWRYFLKEKKEEIH
jgi:hypothetical protein